VRVEKGDVIGDCLFDKLFFYPDVGDAGLAQLLAFPVHGRHIGRGSEKLFAQGLAILVHECPATVVADLIAPASFLQALVLRVRDTASVKFSS